MRLKCFIQALFLWRRERDSTLLRNPAPMVAGQGRLSATGARVRLTQPRTIQKTFPFGKAFCMVRVGGVEPPSQPWEGYIIAVIRHPRNTYRTNLRFFSPKPAKRRDFLPKLLFFLFKPRANPAKRMASERRNCARLYLVIDHLIVEN